MHSPQPTPEELERDAKALESLLGVPAPAHTPRLRLTKPKVDQSRRKAKRKAQRRARKRA